MLVEHCAWIFPYEKICITCNHPHVLAFDNQQRLHRNGFPAIEFTDGFSIYVSDGVPQVME